MGKKSKAATIALVTALINLLAAIIELLNRLI